MKLKSFRVPMLSASVTRLMRLSPDHTDYFDDVLATVEGDAGLSADAFRLASSAAFEGREAPHTVSDALVRIGAQRYVSLILGAHLASVFVVGSPEMHAFWRHSLLVACANRVMACLFPRIGIRPEMAFMAGLMHNVGGMIFALNDSEGYRNLLRMAPLDEGALRRLERSQYDCDHIRVGLDVADHWKLPHEVREAIAYHHSAGIPSGLDHPGMVHLTRLSLELYELMGVRSEPEARQEGPRSRCRLAAGHLGLDLDAEALDRLRDQVEREAEPLFEQLGVPFLH